MKNLLDDLKLLLAADKSKVATSIEALPEQIHSGWQTALKTKIPFSLRRFDSIIFCGMGGSNLASEIIGSLYFDQIKKPIYFVRDYNLPAFANKSSLVIICSYSGVTEETISCFKQAISKNTKNICIAGGGSISSLAQKNRVPLIMADKKLNPSNQPRYGVGLQFGILLGLFRNLKLISISELEIKDAVDLLNQCNDNFNFKKSKKNNHAKSLAEKINKKIPILVGAEFLSGNTHILANQIHESAKNFACHFNLPELNHHLMEGLALPTAANREMKFIFFTSSLYQPRIIKRIMVTKKILAEQNIDYIDYQIFSLSKLNTALEILSFGSWLSFYLSVLNEKDPSDIKWVKLFKAQLKK